MNASLNRLNKLLFCALVLGLSACNKKSRLTSSTYDFSITPPAAMVLKNQTLTLTAKGSSAHGSIDVAPTWSVSPTSPSTLDIDFGPTVQFQSSALGDYIVTANFDGRETTTRIAVVAFLPSANTFDVYDDDLPVEAGLDVDIFASVAPDPVMDLSELDAGYTPEGLQYQRATNAPDDSFWGVTLDKNSLSLSRDMSAFNGGYLKFAIRLHRVVAALPTEEIQIHLGDAVPVTVIFTLTSGANGFSRLSTDWQEVSIPIASFAGLNTSLVRVPFAIVMETLTSNLTFDIDAVRWDTQP